MKKTAKFLVICEMICCMCAVVCCMMAGYGQQVETEDAETVLTEADGAGKTGIETGCAAENKKYNLRLPGAEAFAEELKDFIYWEHATMIEKDVHDLMSIWTILGDACLEKDLKLHFCFYECDVSEMDQQDSNHYNVVVTLPEEEEKSFFSFTYNARGLSLDYDYGNEGWFDKDVAMYLPSCKLEEKKWFQKQYTFFGEASIRLSKEEAEHYEVRDYFAEGEKEQILAAIKKAIRKRYKKSKNLVVCVRDFLPGDTRLSGREINLHIADTNSIPLHWIQSFIYYPGKKMKKFDNVYWDTHYSTAYSGASQPDYNPTVKQLKKWAKEELEEVDIEKCILAYQMKDGRMIDLKAGKQG